MLLLFVLAAISFAAGTAYYYRTSIENGFVAGHDAVLSHLGLGVVLAGMWLAGAAGMLKGRQLGLGSPRVWAASVLFLVAGFGVLAFLSADSGTMAYFTLEGGVRLGGKLGGWISGITGESVSGTAYMLGALRVAAVSAAAVAILSPALARVTGGAGLSALMYAYVGAAVGARSAFASIRRLYRYEPTRERMAPVYSEAGFAPDAAPPQRAGMAAAAAQPAQARPVERTPSEFAEYAVADAAPEHVSVTAAPVFAAATQTLDSVAEQDTPAAATATTDTWDSAVEHDESPADAPAEPYEPGEGPAVEPDPLTGRFNRFWSVPEPGEELGSNGHLPGEHTNGANDAFGQTEPLPPMEEIETIEPPIADEAPAAPTLPAWSKPPIYLLDDAPQTGISDEEISETAEAIRASLGEYGVEVEIGQVKPGPAVTMYGLTPGWVRRYKQVRERNEDGTPKLDDSGKQIVLREETRTRVKVDSILQREKDLALALKTPSIRIETPVMGQSLLGIEVPNPNPSVVTLRSVMESEEFKRLRSDSHLPVALGKGSGGETMVTDLTKMPHLLIAGATGSGKSVCINGIVSCLAMEKTPDEMQMLLVDPKRVELTPYNGIPHLLTPVVVETDQVVGLLKGVIREMMDRYRRMEELSVRNIEAYNRKADVRMPFLVVVVDELADLMMTASFEIEQSLCRLAQLGRATGIHLIIATQRPSVDVLTGLIKANFPSRISFGVSSQIDSRTILDTAGAEKLLGRGDLLFQPIDASRPERVQGVWISDTEVNDLVSYWKATPRGPLPAVNLDAVPEDTAADGAGHSEVRDDMLDRAIELAMTQSKMSTSLLQRRLRIGYPRAARLMDQLEDEGVVGPSDGAKSRDVIISTG